MSGAIYDDEFNNLHEINKGIPMHGNEKVSEEVVLFEVIKARRSVRSYKDGDVSRELLLKILEAGQWAPSPSNVQSWRFIVVTEKKHLERLKAISPGFPRKATAAILICSDQKDMERFGGTLRPILAAEEAAMAVQNMLLMAHSLGVGSCPVASFSAVGVRTLMDLPPHFHPILLVALGFSSECPHPPARKELDRISFWERYQEG